MDLFEYEYKIHAINPIYKVIRIENRNEKRRKSKRRFYRELESLEQKLEDDVDVLQHNVPLYDEILYNIKDETNVNKLRESIQRFLGRKYYAKNLYYEN